MHPSAIVRFLPSLLALPLLSGCVIDGVTTVQVPGRSYSSSTVVVADASVPADEYEEITYVESYDEPGITIVSDSYDAGWRGQGQTTYIAPPPPPVVLTAPRATPVPTEKPALDPIIQSFTANPSNVVPPGQPITFKVVAVDPGKEPLQYNWSATGGLLSTNTGQVVSWLPPEKPGVYTVSAVISNGRGGTVSGTQNMVVKSDGKTAFVPVMPESTRTSTTTVVSSSTSTTTALFPALQP